MSTLFLHNATLVTMNTARDQIEDGAIQIDGDKIVAIGKTDDLLPQLPPDAEQVDCTGRILFPGMINTHVHTSQQLGRGLSDDVSLLVWLRERTWPYESNMTEADSEISTLLFGLEQIRNGVTCFAESGGQHVAGMVKATQQLGLRGVVSRSTMDEGIGLPNIWQESTDTAIEKQLALLEQFQNAADDRIRVWFSLRTIFNNSDDLITRTRDLAAEHNTGIMMHIAEIREENDYVRETRGASTVQHLNNLGLLAPNLLAAHCVWMTDEEIDLFADHDVKVSHCPAAAMRVLGFAKIPEMIDKGISVSIGTDGAPCNNRMSLIDEMWLTALIHKGRLNDPTTMPTETILSMVTNEGAKAVLWDDEIGSLEVGKKADLIVINPNTPNMLPIHDPIANMVSAMKTDNIESTMVDGVWLMRDRQIVCVDENAILEEAQERADAIRQRGGVQLPDRFHVI